MKTIIISIALLCSLFLSAQDKISIADFKAIEGKWKGTLTYLDYSSNKPVTIPANTMIEIVSDSSFDQYVYYTEEPDKSKKSRYTISANGDMLDEKKLLQKTILPDGSIKLLLESKGPDGNDQKPATFQHVMILSATLFKITKLVKFDGEENFFQRHEYAFSR